MKLTLSNKNEYYINNRKNFNGIPIDTDQISKAFEFAYEMCFGSGHHRSHRSGGQTNRKNGEFYLCLLSNNER